ncbi:CvpA family protein [Siculibacillus lacustris]|uniref:CvpA family protein n=1 Tax=Siculibacillus lacustris TaxID=1549641 RepID=A0A4Q9VVL3_9HYPH|nr:CvpA family protein [Siculibacillus lacustris]TBW39800.1 CvpA family protein [Siculibacillus lacustris]
MDFVTLLDGIVITVMLVSALLAMYRGFLREVLSIASWAAAAAVAAMFYKQLLPSVKIYVPNDNVAMGLTIAALFIVTLLVVSWITMKISDFVLDSAFGALDRTVGFLFGAARGLLLVVVAMQFFNWFVPPAQQPRWVSAAKSKPIVDYLGERLMAALPEDAEKLLLQKFKKRAPDDGAPQEPPDLAKPAPAKSSEAPATAPVYRPGEKRQIEQIITSTGKAP